MIRVNKLSYRYPGSSVNAVDGISFNVNKGEIFGFLGPNGAGKSTTQKILIGLLKGYNGEVEVSGRAINKIKEDYYERIGVAFEFPNLYSRFTGIENLEFFQSLYRGAGITPEKLLRHVGLDKDAHLKTGSYSKGMKMRLNFARALINNPSLLFLDEPTSGLDPVNSKIMKDMIFKQKSEGKTVFLTTHNMSAADELCDRVAFIVAGRISLIDSPRNLKLSQGQRSVCVESNINGKTVSKDFPLHGIGDNSDFIDFLRSGDPETMHSAEASLEDIFIKTTGSRLL